jgi:type IV secretory pathway VirB10-like protein
VDRDLQQLLITGAVILFALFDLLLRWAKKKMDGPGQAPRPLPRDVEQDRDDGPVGFELPWPLPDAPPARRPPPPPVKRPEPVRSVQVVAPRTPEPSVVRARTAPLAAPRRPVVSARPGGTLQGLGDARRAIVLGAVLGPPRAFDEYH